MVEYIPFLLAKLSDDSDFMKLKVMATVHDDWNLDYDKNNIKIWSKNNNDDSVKMIKVWSIFSAIRSIDLYNTIMDQSYRQEWDPHLLLKVDIGYLNRNNAASYYAISCPPPLKSRDFVLQNSWLNKGSEHYALNHSISHKDYPPKRGFVRAISYMTGYYIRVALENGCEMTFVSQTDPQGIIPHWIVNKCTQIFVPRFVKQLERAATAYPGWKSQNNPDDIPWLNASQITSWIPISDCLPCDEEQGSHFFKYLLAKVLKNSPGSLKYEHCPYQPCTSRSQGEFEGVRDHVVGTYNSKGSKKNKPAKTKPNKSKETPNKSPNERKRK